MKKVISIIVLCINVSFAAMCPPCICTEATSSSSSQNYLQSQTAVLSGFITPDIQKATEVAKIMLEKTKQSYETVLEKEELSISVLKDEAEIVSMLEKIVRKKEEEIINKVAHIRAKIRNNQLQLINSKK